MKYGIPAPRLANRQSRPALKSCLEQAGHPLRDGQAKMLVGPLRQDPAARRPLDQPLLEQVGLEDVLDRVGLLADGDGEGREPDRAPRELARHQFEELAIVAIEPRAIDL